MTWFALYTIGPLKAVRELTEARFTTYAPTEPKTGRRARVTAEPILGAYVLAEIPAERFHDALSCEHVAYCVGMGGEPREIPGPVVDDLREMVAALQAIPEEVVPAREPKRNHKRPKRRKRKQLIGLASLMILVERQTQHLAGQAEPCH